MFQFFRRRDTAVRVFLGGLLVLICIMMVVTLIPGLTGSSASDETTLARVGGEKITSTDVQHQLQLLLRNSRLPSSMIPLYAPKILDQMVVEQASLMEAKRLGLSVSSNELAIALQGNPYFFPGGKFVGNEQYEAIVQNQYGMTVPQFEDKAREQVLLEKLRRLVTSGATVNDGELQKEFHLRNDKLKIDFVALKNADLKDKVKLTDEDTNAYFQKNRNRYEVPERRRFNVVFVDTSKLRQGVALSPDDLQHYYSQNKERFRVEDRVHLEHILFKTTGKSPAEVDEIQKKAQAVLDRLKKGEDFAALAKDNSDDASTTAKGGDLGWIVRGQTVPEIEKTAFSLQPGQLSGVIKTIYGFEILRVLDKERAHQQTLQEVMAQIVEPARAEKVQRIADDAARKAEAALKKTPNDISAAAKAVGVEVQPSEWVKRGDPTFGGSAALDDALFSPTLKINQLTPVVQATNGVLVAQLVEVSPAHPAELAEVRTQVENDARNDKTTKELAAKMNDLAAAAKKSGDLKKAAAALGLKVATSDPFTRDGTVKDLGAASSLGENAFSMKPGDVGGPVDITEGKAVFEVVERTAATDAEFAQKKDQLKEELVQSKANTLYQLFNDSLKTRLEREGKLSINEAALQRLASTYQ